MIGLLILATLSAIGCSSGSTAPRTRDVGGAYELVVNWFVEQSVHADDRPVVFLEALGEGVSIDLDTQAAIISDAADVAKVRFIDHPSEALDLNGVRDDGLFIALGSLVDDGETSTIECDEIISETVRTRWTFRVEFVDRGWRLHGDPLPTP